MARDLQADAELGEKLAEAAWSAIGPFFRGTFELSNKTEAGSDYDPVTSADKAAEQAIRDVLAKERPDDGILGEEFPETQGRSGWKWVLDPIDGTRAFVAGLPVWTTLIALCDETGTPRLGIIDQPVLGERYIGTETGSFLVQDGSRTQISVSSCTDLRKAVIATTDPFIFTPAEEGAWTHLRATARITRYGLDAYAYARLAAGSIDLVAESQLAPYDAAALIPIVRGAGGVATDWRGKPAMPGGQLVCASSEGVLEQALLALRRSADV